MVKTINCEISIGKITSNQEGQYFQIEIRNRKEKININVKMNAEQFANILTSTVEKLPVNINIDE